MKRSRKLSRSGWRDRQEYFYFSGINSLPEKCHKCIKLSGDCIEKQSIVCNISIVFYGRVAELFECPSYYVLAFICLMCPSASSTNCVWWCADARTALLHSVWHYTGHQSRRLYHDTIFVRLLEINWQSRHIGGPRTAVRLLLSLARRHGTRCQNVYVTSHLVLLFSAVFSKHFFRVLLVSSALEALSMMHYIYLHFTLHYISWCLAESCRNGDQHHPKGPCGLGRSLRFVCWLKTVKSLQTLWSDHNADFKVKAKVSFYLTPSSEWCGASRCLSLVGELLVLYC